MAVRIRMKRIGAKNNPVFRIVVADGRSPRHGKFIEQCDHYQQWKRANNSPRNKERGKYGCGKAPPPTAPLPSFFRKVPKAPPNPPPPPPVAPPPAAATTA